MTKGHNKIITHWGAIAVGVIKQHVLFANRDDWGSLLQVFEVKRELIRLGLRWVGGGWLRDWCTF